MLLLFINCETNATTIECEYYHDNRIYFCIGRVFNTEMSKNVTEILGNHVPTKANEDVNQLYCLAQGLTFFPQNIERFFPNLETIDFSRNLIISVTNSHLKPFQSLMHLNLLGNRITELERDIFENLPKLKIIDFNYNNIKNVDYDITFPKHSLSFFKGNPCINMIAQYPSEMVISKCIFRSLCPPLTVKPEGYLDNLENTTKTNILEECHRHGQIVELNASVTLMEKRMAFLESKMEDLLGHQFEIEDTTNEIL